MSTTVIAHPVRTPGQTVTAFAKESWCELLKYLRIPMYAGSTLAFPIMFYTLFGLLMNRGGRAANIGVSTYLIATYGAFGVIAASLFANGVGVAVDRGLGWMQVKRASPMPPLAYFVAKFFVSLVFSLVIVVALITLGTLFGGVRLSAAQAAELIAVSLCGVAPFCALGLAIGYLSGPNSAPAIVNLVYLPLSFASGLWFPVEALPRFLQHTAAYLPPYHLAQLALGVVGAARPGSALNHFEFLLGFTLLSLGVAYIGYQHDEGRMFG